MELVQKMLAGAGRDPHVLVRSIGMSVVMPLLSLVLFVALWAGIAPRIETSLGAFPGPAQVLEQTQVLWQGHLAERADRDAFYQRQNGRNKEKLAADPSYEPRHFVYNGKPTFLDQIVTSLITVFTGFLLATVVQVPLAIPGGLVAYRCRQPSIRSCRSCGWSRRWPGCPSSP